jgi:hypothetical protein
MRLPTIHLNGTSASELLTGYLNARNAVFEAIEAMKEAAPNGRDYYPQDTDVPSAAYNIAAREHRTRVEMLRVVAAELYELAQHVSASSNAPEPQTVTS